MSAAVISLRRTTPVADVIAYVTVSGRKISKNTCNGILLPRLKTSETGSAFATSAVSASP
jgi:hypothetical protein